MLKPASPRSFTTISVSIVLFVYLIIDMRKNKLATNKMLKIYCASVFMLIIFYLLSSILDGHTNVFKALFVDGLRFGGTAGEEFSNLPINLNANTIAYYCASEIAMATALFKNHDLSNKEKVSFAVITIILLFLGIMTGSRTFIIVLVVYAVLVWFCSLKTMKQICVSVIMLLLAILAIAIVMNSNIPTVNLLIERFGREDVASMNGRTEILAQYIEKFTANDLYFLFGSGVTDYRFVYDLTQSIHNGIAQILVCSGMIGFLFFGYILLNPIVLAVRKKRAFYKYIPLITCFIFIQTIQLLNPFILMFPFAFSYLAIFSENPKSEMEKQLQQGSSKK